GDAGNVRIEAGDLRIDGRDVQKLTGIASTVDPWASGLVGDLEIRAGNVELLNGGAISNAHMGELSPEKLSGFEGGKLRIEAVNMTLAGASEVSASSTGSAPASAIEMNISGGLTVEGSSRITTSAVHGAGGDVRVSGADYVMLRDGVITTSSESGVGGDIVLDPQNLVLDTGFIQANAIEGSRGGNIFIGAEAVIPGGGRLIVGGDERLDFTPGAGVNVIQAAAPGGEAGNIEITAPEVDISATLAEMGVEPSAPIRLTTDPCLSGDGNGGGALVLCGRGGIPEAPGDPSTVSFREDRLDRLLAPNTD
ncbi:MAG: hypothetical protein GY859_15920, partial [Desulfobacterales bacterium]|nr:hypothetical protein [Desulfobacterales bacterium]